jgi:polyhydroxyalkanoate synthesis regulator phasin
MTSGVLDQLKARGEELFGRVSAELMANPNFMKAMETAWKGKARIDEAVGEAMKRMNIPTRTEFKRAVRRIDDLERQLAELKAQAAKPARKPRAAPARAPRKAAPKKLEMPPAEPQGGGE